MTGYVPLPASSWTADIANVWKTSITSSSFNYVLFGYVGSNGTVGSVWGTKFTTGKSALVAPYQFFFSSNVLYVYSPTATNPANYYGSMAAMLSDQAIARYREDGAAPIEIDSGECERLGIRVHEAPLLADALGREVRHDPDRVAAAICTIARA